MHAFAASHWKDAAVGIAAALVALGVIWRYIVQPIFRGTRSAWHTIDRVEKAVTFVEAELRPNGGSSLRDAVNRIEARTVNHEARLTALESTVVNIEAKLREPVVTSTTTTTKVKTVEPAHLEEAS